VFDALISGTETIRFDPGRKAILLFSDGEDTSSVNSERDVVARAQETECVIVLVRVEPSPPPGPRAAHLCREALSSEAYNRGL